MATYKGIKGFNIQTVSSDPPAPFIGQVWYNSTSATVKYRDGATSASWASGGALTTARTSLAGCGIQTAALAFGGDGPGGNSNATEEYNGTAWTNGGNLPLAKFSLAGAGIQTAALAFGGSAPGTPNPQVRVSTEEYNGSSWTAGGAMSNMMGSGAGAGTQTAGLGFGGQSNSPVNTTEEYRSYDYWKK